MTGEIARPLCDVCASPFGKSTPSDVKVISPLKNEWHMYLCADCAESRGYITDYGSLPCLANFIIEDVTEGE